MSWREARGTGGISPCHHPTAVPLQNCLGRRIIVAGMRVKGFRSITGLPSRRHTDCLGRMWCLTPRFKRHLNRVPIHHRSPNPSSSYALSDAPRDKKYDQPAVQVDFSAPASVSAEQSSVRHEIEFSSIKTIRLVNSIVHLAHLLLAHLFEDSFILLINFTLKKNNPVTTPNPIEHPIQ